jgi:sensor c-di-GMP phosphodiesterase-like protein
MITKEKRVLNTLPAVLLAALLGVLVGYVFGHALIVQLMKSSLVLGADRILVEEESGAAESRAVLEAMNTSHDVPCSDRDITLMRKLIYDSKYLKDAGRMREGRILCSATLDSSSLPIQALHPDMVRRDGTRVYRNIGPLRVQGYSVITVELNGAFIVYNPFHESDLIRESPPYVVSDKDASNGIPSRTDGGLLLAPPSIFDHDGQSSYGDYRYATRCSKRFTSCITTFQSVSAALRSNRTNLIGYLCLSGLTGALSGLLLALSYRRSRSLEQQLRRAIQRDKLQMVYQPIVDLGSGRIVHAEALARWTDESGFAVGSDVFVRIAEERGFVGKLTELVVHHVLREFSKKLREDDQFRININITAADLADSTFLPMLEGALAKFGVLPRSVAIEVTESSTVRVETAKEAIRQLRARGHSVQIDDFGTGYSSLAYLNELCVDTIKVDRVFTRAIGTDAVTVGILPLILSMAETLHLNVIVEGIETVEQAAYFAGLDAPVLGQGWLFGRPIPAEEFHANLARIEKESAVLPGRP